MSTVQTCGGRPASHVSYLATLRCLRWTLCRIGGKKSWPESDFPWPNPATMGICSSRRVSGMERVGAPEKRGQWGAGRVRPVRTESGEGACVADGWRSAIGTRPRHRGVATGGVGEGITRPRSRNPDAVMDGSGRPGGERASERAQSALRRLSRTWCSANTTRPDRGCHGCSRCSSAPSRSEPRRCSGTRPASHHARPG